MTRARLAVLFAVAVFAPTAVASAEPPKNLAPPSITGSAQVGKVLTAEHGLWEPTPSSYTYSWERCNSEGTGCTYIPGAGTQTYTVASADKGHELAVLVAAWNSLNQFSWLRAGPTATVTEVEARTTNCFEATSEGYSRLTECGFPTPASTGPEPGHVLTNKTGTVIPAEGENLHDQRIEGNVRITHANVTLENVEVVPPNNACQPAKNETVECGNNYTPVTIENAAGTVIRHVKIACAVGKYQEEGKRCAHAITSSGANAIASPPMITYTNFANGAIKLYSGGTIENSYCDMEQMNGVPSKQQHYECFSDQGESGKLGAPIRIIHNTLLQPHDQTAVIFLQSLFGPLNSETVENNLMAGGGYLVYHEEREGHPVGTLTLKGNRVGRACKGDNSHIVEGHHICPAQTLNNSNPSGAGYEQAIPQFIEDGYYPAGGSYGTMISVGGTVVQSGNVWDDTGGDMGF